MTATNPISHDHPNLVLIGGRGCGKSSLARELARLHSSFSPRSSDELILAERPGASIPDIVAAEGWKGFRELEYAVLVKLIEGKKGSLLDCGGGGVVDVGAGDREVFSERKVRALQQYGFVVYLHCDTKTLLTRIGGDAQRPALSASESFEEIMQRRDPWYRLAADSIIEADELSIPKLAEAVLAVLPESRSWVREANS